jgi:hypothetical protein
VFDSPVLTGLEAPVFEAGAVEPPVGWEKLVVAGV